MAYQFETEIAEIAEESSGPEGFGKDVVEVIEFNFGFAEGENEMQLVEELPAVEEQMEDIELPDTDVLSLSSVIEEKYADMLTVGTLTTGNLELWKDSSLLDQIIELYPQLYTLGPVSELGASVPADNPLTVLGREKAQELLLSLIHI